MFQVSMINDGGSVEGGPNLDHARRNPMSTWRGFTRRTDRSRSIDYLDPNLPLGDVVQDLHSTASIYQIMQVT